MLYSIRSKLVISFISVALVVGSFSLIAGWNLLYTSVLNEAFNRIRQDLNVARVIYDDRVAAVRLALETACKADDLVSALGTGNLDFVKGRISRAAGDIDLDFAGVMFPEGRIMSCIQGFPGALEQTQDLPVFAMAEGKIVSGTVVVRREGEAACGMALGAAVPVVYQGAFVGVVFGGICLNRDTAIVDKIGDTVFRNETYDGRNVGTATIFFADKRISTSVLDENGRRAEGTLASKAVAERVLGQGENWTDRAYVVNDWYITAYEPITDIRGRRVGMLYVGVPEAKYRGVRHKTVAVFLAITFAGVLLAICAGTVLASRIMQPVSHLIRASKEISQGNFSPDTGPLCTGDIGVLQKAFKNMSHALVRRDQDLVEERQRDLIRSEKQASIGKLAAGVAHEINNPLTPILTFTHLILRRKDLPDPVRQDLETIAAQTERVRKIVKGLLDFSRQRRLDRQVLNPKSMLADAISLMENQALIRGVSLSCTPSGELPDAKLDGHQLQIVLVNLILNALDATPSGGSIHICAKALSLEDKPGIEIRVKDTGAGIIPEHLDRLFDPFFTTKEVGEGTGLGLSVSQGIVERHGGSIRVESALQTGTTFIIWLPCDRDNEMIPERKSA